MTGLLLDTNAVSMFSPSKAGTSSAFAGWVEEQEKLETIYLSAVTIDEIERAFDCWKSRARRRRRRS